MIECLVPVREGATAYQQHAAVYEALGVVERREFRFAPAKMAFGDSVYVRGTFTVPAGLSAWAVPDYGVGERLVFRLRANPTVKHNGKAGQIGLGVQKDSLRDWWISRRAAEHGFRLLEMRHSTERELIGRNPPFVLNVTTYSGILEVEDADAFKKALGSGIGRGGAWGCGLLLVQRETF